MIEIYYWEKTIKKASIKDIGKLKNKKLWLDVTNITREEARLLKNAFDLHPLTEEDLLIPITRIKVEAFSHYLLCIFHGIQKLNGIEIIEIDYVIGKNFLITNHKNKLPNFEDLKDNPEHLKALFDRGLDFIFYRLLDDEVMNYYPVLEVIDGEIDKIEETVTRNPKPEMMRRILQLKRQISLIKKSAFPQREKLSYLAKQEYQFISEKAIPYFRDIYDHSIRVADTIDNYRDAIGNTFEVYMSAVSNSMNEVMKLLSIIATIALPLTVISSIYGTNFQNLPGSTYHYGFWVMIAGMIAVSAVLIYHFRKKQWF